MPFWPLLIRRTSQCAKMWGWQMTNSFCANANAGNSFGIFKCAQFISDRLIRTQPINASQVRFVVCGFSSARIEGAIWIWIEANQTHGKWPICGWRLPKMPFRQTNMVEQITVPCGKEGVEDILTASHIIDVECFGIENGCYAALNWATPYSCRMMPHFINIFTV